RCSTACVVIRRSRNGTMPSGGRTNGTRGSTPTSRRERPGTAARIAVMDPHPSRRAFVSQSLLGLGVLALPPGEAAPPPARPVNVVCVGGHPDDPETGCGGTLAAYAERGHRATVVYLTRGERGIAGRSLSEAAAIRTAEATEACRILGAKAVFAGQ